MHFITAERIFDGKEFLEAGSVLVLNDAKILQDIISSADIDAGRVERLEGFIMPGFINAHCHTELSHLINRIPTKTGLPEFGKNIILSRGKTEIEEILECAKEADRTMKKNGIAAVGDISNTEMSFKMKKQSSLFYHTFIEILGLDPKRAKTAFEDGLKIYERTTNSGFSCSLAPHAPYSTSKELISMISDFNCKNKLPSSIHNEESYEEIAFFKGEKSGFHDLYDFLQADISWFRAPDCTSLTYYYNALGEQNTLLVHNTFTEKSEIDLMNDKHINWCFCPSANLYIEDRLPQFDLFIDKNFCLGTDSLASNTDLCMIKEANVLMKNSSFTLEQILQSITSNGARALQIDKEYGSLLKGKNSGMNLIKFNNNQLHFIKKIS